MMKTICQSYSQNIRICKIRAITCYIIINIISWFTTVWLSCDLQLPNTMTKRHQVCCHFDEINQHTLADESIAANRSQKSVFIATEILSLDLSPPAYRFRQLLVHTNSLQTAAYRDFTLFNEKTINFHRFIWSVAPATSVGAYLIGEIFQSGLSVNVNWTN